MGKGKHTGQKIHENPDLENSIPSTWDIQSIYFSISGNKHFKLSKVY